MTIGISFIICTIEKNKEDTRLAEVIENVKKQTDISYEIIFVWDGRNTSTPPSYDGVKVISVDLVSIAEARNIGGTYAKYDVLCFLDDDTYPKELDFSNRVIGLLKSNNIDFLTCNIYSSGSVMSGASVPKDIVLDERNIIADMWEPGLTIKKSAFDKVKFDPTLGIGCIHGSSEGFDFGFRLLQNGFKGMRFHSVLIDHPPLDGSNDYRVERYFFYSLGNGAVLIQHKYYFTFIWQVSKTVARLFVSLIRGDGIRARASFIRALCMLIGPFLPRRRARILPASSPKVTRGDIVILRTDEPT